MRVGILLGDRGNEFWTAMRLEYEALAPSLNVEVDIRNAEPEKDPAAQAAELRRMVEASFDALVVNPITQDNLVDGILLAASGGLRVFDVGAKTDARLVVDAGAFYIPVRTVDFKEQGRLAGEYISERIIPGHQAFRQAPGAIEPDAGGESGAETAEVAIILGRPGSAQSIGRAAGASEALEAHGVRVVAEEPADFDRRLAAAVARRLIRKQPGLAALFCVNDLMALGVAETLAAEVSEMRRRSASPPPLVVGVDGTEEALAAVSSGLLAATVAFDPADVARVVLSAVKSMLKGGEIAPGYPVRSRLVTSNATRHEAGAW